MTSESRLYCQTSFVSLVLLAGALALESCSAPNARRSANGAAETPSVPAESLRIAKIALLERAGSGTVAKTDNGWHVSLNGGEFAAAIPISLPVSSDSAATVEARVRVAAGKVGVGLLTAENHILDEHTLEPKPDAQLLSFRFSPAQNARFLLFRGGDINGKRAEALVEGADVILQGVPISGALLLDKAQASQSGTFQPGPPMRVLPPPAAYSYGVSVPLSLDGSSKALLVRAKLQVIRGEVGVGILTKDLKDFQAQEFRTPESKAADVFVPIPNPRTAGSVVIRNGKPKEGTSEAIVEGISVYSIK